MTKAAIFFVCLLCVSFAHKDKKEQLNSIYKPFTDVPKPEDAQPETDEIAVEKIVHDHQNLSQDKQKQYQEFNEMLGYGLVFGTLLLACMLMKTCATSGRRNRQTTVNMIPATQNQVIRAPMLNKNVSRHEIKNRIQWHKNQIKRLERESKQFEQAQRRSFQMQQLETKRQQEAIKVYYNQMQMHQAIQPRVYYNQNAAFVNNPQYYNQQYIPVGRPMPKDNDSSFASEYPVI